MQCFGVIPAIVGSPGSGRAAHTPCLLWHSNYE